MPISLFKLRLHTQPSFWGEHEIALPPPQHLKLMFGGIELPESSTFDANEIKQDATLRVTWDHEQHQPITVEVVAPLYTPWLSLSAPLQSQKGVIGRWAKARYLLSAKNMLLKARGGRKQGGTKLVTAWPTETVGAFLDRVVGKADPDLDIDPNLDVDPNPHPNANLAPDGALSLRREPAAAYPRADRVREAAHDTARNYRGRAGEHAHGEPCGASGGLCTECAAHAGAIEPDRGGANRRPRL